MMLDDALTYARAGWAVLPLEPAGKEPLTRHGVRDATTDEAALRRAWARRPDANIGLRMGGGLVVIDVDGAAGRARCAELEEHHGGLPATYTVRTGKPQGQHRYFRVPADARVSNRPLAPDLDVRGPNTYVVAPPSVHHTGVLYEIELDVDVAPLPAAWLALITKRDEEPARAPSEAVGRQLDPYLSKALAMGVERVRTAEQGRRNDVLNVEVYSLAKYGAQRHLIEAEMKAAAAAAGLEEAEIRKTFGSAFVAGAADRVENPYERTKRECIAAVRGGMSQRAAAKEFKVAKTTIADWVGREEVNDHPPTTHDRSADHLRPAPTDLGLGADDAQDAHDRESGREEVNDHPPVSEPFTPAQHGHGGRDWRRDLQHSATTSAPKAVMANALLYLRHLDDLAGAFAFDEGGTVNVVVRSLPWNQRAEVLPRAMRDEDAIEASGWIGRKERANFATKMVGEAMLAVSKDNVIDPLRDYLDGLVWDGVERLESWLIDWFGCPNTVWARAVGSRWAIAAVARALKPGTKVDNVLILEGAQGKRKSTGIAALVGEQWFSDEDIDISNKDSRLSLGSTWVQELAEGEVFKRASTGAMKAFLTRRQDIYRPPYGKHNVTVPRRTVFISSTNDVEYLRDPTGARRFWPVRCESVDIDAVRRGRDQLWAEAVHAYRAGTPWWIDNTDDDLMRVARIETEQRYEADPWEPKVLETIERGIDVSVAWVLERMQKPLHLQTAADAVRVGKILRRYGWVRTLKGDARLAVWNLPDGEG